MTSILHLEIINGNLIHRTLPLPVTANHIQSLLNLVITVKRTSILARGSQSFFASGSTQKPLAECDLVTHQHSTERTLQSLYYFCFKNCPRSFLALKLQGLCIPALENDRITLRHVRESIPFMPLLAVSATFLLQARYRQSGRRVASPQAGHFFDRTLRGGRLQPQPEVSSNYVV